MIKTVTGNIPEENIGITLAHEHICCYSEYLYKMSGDKYLNKDELAATAVKFLKELKEKYSLSTFIDCTPVNIGRDIELLKEVSELSEVNIICSTGFYYTEEPLFYNLPTDTICECIINDAVSSNAGIIKCAAEYKSISPLNEKLLRASAKAQLKLGLPIVMHTNAEEKNGIDALEIILSEGVKPQAVTVSHLSDTEDNEYKKYFAECGCHIGLDRLYEDQSDDYIKNKIKSVTFLCESGYEDRILLSHDALFFNGFEEYPEINKAPRLNYCFDNILPGLPRELTHKIMSENVVNMLKCI